ncbi:unnamed protein product [Notodromas monacha]|uniref:Protein kinase domain-containing protein n=1 Tax=Notodromas monacha TaxID=399045 RepID=A0A7R9BL52_9CRUS|nr:unnamed protein product [Notodromas monacha]CAG0916660.1 unnamed protein product [Notodromas monacha]
MAEGCFKTPAKPKGRTSKGIDVSGGKFNLEIPASPFLARLGYGTGVSVYSLDRGKEQSPWAIKKLNKFYRERQTVQKVCLEKEAELMRKLNHPNIIGFRSYTQTPEGPMLLLEKCDWSLLDVIEERVDKGSNAFEAWKIEKVAKDVVFALEFLHHTLFYMHGDLKSANVLVNGDFDAVKLCDFGVAVKMDEDFTAPAEEYTGTRYWLAKEVLEGSKERITNKAEMYSYGLTVFEMLSLSFPHMEDATDCSTSTETDSSFPEDEDSVVDESENSTLGTRPYLPERLAAFYAADKNYNDILSIYFLCTSENAGERPAANHLASSFREKMAAGEA